MVYWKNFARDFYAKKLSEVKKQPANKSPPTHRKPEHKKKETILISDPSSSASFSSSSSSSSYRSKPSPSPPRSKKRKYTHSRNSPKDCYYSSISSDSDMHDVGHSPVVQNESVNLVSVLRILSALDSELGLLGGKVIDLLAKSLEFEKMKPNSSESLLNGENVIFLETVKEKLKGLISTDLVSTKKKVGSTFISFKSMTLIMLLLSF
jgi:hypothetical protein